MTFIPTKETLAKGRATLNSGWRPPITKKADDKQEKIYEEMNHPLAKLKQGAIEYDEKIYAELIHPLAKLKQETVEYAEKITRELEVGKYIVDDEMENVYELPIDGGGSSSKAEPPEVGSETDPTSVLEVSQDGVSEKAEVGSLSIFSETAS